MEKPGWKLISSEPSIDLNIFRVNISRYKNLRNETTLDAVILDAPDWVNIVALTGRQQIIMVEQFRFGAGEISLEIPAGLIEPGEDHLQAAKRELSEETGYTSEQWEYLGMVKPNPAFLNNHCHFWLARNARLTSQPNPDPGENLEMKLFSPAELIQAVNEGQINHSISLAALSRIFDLRKKSN
jgi:ADP-ribose pyrophosphatase